MFCLAGISGLPLPPVNSYIVLTLFNILVILLFEKCMIVSTSEYAFVYIDTNCLV